MTMGRSGWWSIKHDYGWSDGRVGGPSSMTMGGSGWWSIKYDYGTVGLVVHQV